MSAQSSTSTLTALQKTPIAIIGMSALFAKAKNLQEYWENILGKVNGITEVPESAWNLEDYYDPDPKAPDKTYGKWGGFLPKIDFDPLEFGLPPDTLEALDSAHLLGLVMAKKALEDAGYDQGKEFNRETTGVILGGSGLWKSITPLTSRLQYPLWKKICQKSGLSQEQTDKIIENMKASYVPWQENSFPGMLPNVVAGRITNRFDLGGTNCVVDAACASSLSALKMAISELIEGRCDMMLTGGFDTDNSILNYMCFSKTPAFSKKDCLNPFDATSDGMMVGEGLGMLVIKRLEDAERDGDRIYAVIKGIGTASDGRFKSIYAPRPEGQVRALRRAYQEAGFSPATLGLVEAHGTGTPAGDFCEFTALNEVFSENNAEKQTIALGSVKSQIGHTKAAAGAASLIKTTLALHHKILPATINITEPNPKFKIEDSPFYLNTETRPWLPKGETPRRAGVSSFGFGGTDYHVVLEEYTPKLPQGENRIHHRPQSILLWGQNPEELRQTCQKALEQLQSPQGLQVYIELQNQSKSAQLPLKVARVGFVATSLAEAIKLLQAAVKQLQKQPQAEAWEHPQGIYYRKTGLLLEGKVVALFPGQGSQYLNMGREIALNLPEIQTAYQKLDILRAKAGLTPLSAGVFPIPTFNEVDEKRQTSLLQRTENAQPAIGAFSVGLYKTLQKTGFKPNFVAGHSFGELTALWAAGVFTDDDYYYLIQARGQSMAAPKGATPQGAMLAVTGKVSQIAQWVEGMANVQIANYNAPEQVVLSGLASEIATIEKILSSQGYQVTPLPVSAAFHTSLVRHASQPFGKALDQVTFHAPQLPVYANVTAAPYPKDLSGMRQLLEAQLLNSVQFVQQIENIYAQGGYCFVEIGPRQILTNLVKQILGDRPHLAIALNPSRQKDSDIQLSQGVMQLRVLGLPLNDLENAALTVKTSSSKRKGMTLKLNATNYISDKTKALIGAALQPDSPAEIEPSVDSQTVESKCEEVKGSENEEILASIPSVNPYPSDSQPLSEEIPTLNLSIVSQDQTVTMTMNNAISNNINPILQAFYQYQQSLAKVHEEYIKHQSQSFQSVLQLLKQKEITVVAQIDELSTPAAASENSKFDRPNSEVSSFSFPDPAPFKSEPQPLRTLEPQPLNIAPQPLRTPEPEPVHISPIVNYLEPRQPIAPISTPEPVSGVSEPSLDSIQDDALSQALLEVVSEKTGYPTEMLALEMDLEADLGIDSIKRVEIMGSLQEAFSGLPKLSPEALAEKRTLAHIVQYLREKMMVTEKKIA